MRRKFLLMPGAERALAAAQTWRVGAPEPGAEPPLISPLHLLLGLLADPECRAAQILNQSGVSSATVRERSPLIVPLSESTSVPRRASAWSDSLLAGLYAVEERCWAYPQPLEWTTEHLLLSILCSGDDIANWLATQGLDAHRLEAELHRRYGHDPRPVEIEGLGIAEVPLPEVAGKPFSFPGEVVVATESEQPTKIIQLARDVLPETDRSAPFAEKAPRPAQTVAAVTNNAPATNAPTVTNNSPATNLSTAMLALGSLGVLRVFDAAGNRAREALRVLEDYTRFVLEDEHFLVELKQARHKLQTILGRVPLPTRLAARDTEGDPGTQVKTAAELRRTEPGEVLAANFHRLSEALRSLEEFGKLLDPTAARELEQVRYRTYTLQKAVQTTEDSLSRLAPVQLYVLTDGGKSLAEFQARVSALVAAGVDVLQLRDKSLNDRDLLERGRALRTLTARTGTLFVMNDRPDLARLAEADGVHLGQDDLRVREAREIVGAEALIGVSTHSLEQARRAVLDGANYLGVGPTFPSQTKEFTAFPGLEFVRSVSREIRLPAFAIGGITEGNLPLVLEAGAKRIAVGQTVTAASNPRDIVRQLRELLARPKR